MKPKPSQPVGQVLLPAAAIGSLSILLVTGLELLGILPRVNLTIQNIITQGKVTAYPKSLPEWLLWFSAILFAFALSFTILCIPGKWRRFVLWVTAMVLVAGWAPVLSLAAHVPAIGAPFIAVVWSGVCALVYTTKHLMPVDDISPDLKS